MEAQPTQVLGLSQRDLREQDLLDCLSIHPARMGEELVGRTRAIDAWKQLIPSRSFSAAVIEAPSTAAGPRILGFGADVFVSRAFAEEEVSNPRPGLNARIIASIDSGRSVILSDVQLRSANRKTGLDLVILYGSWRRDVLGGDAVSEVCTALASRFVELHHGYRLNQMITEVVGPEEKSQYEATHAWRIICSFNGQQGSNSALAVITRQDALSVTASVVTVLFHHREPVLQLRDADQQLLLAALSGFTDEELSRKLSLSLAAVKKR